MVGQNVFLEGLRRGVVELEHRGVERQEIRVRGIRGRRFRDANQPLRIVWKILCLERRRQACGGQKRGEEAACGFYTLAHGQS